MEDIYNRRLRLNLKKETHKKVFNILNEIECSGNQLIVDAILYYYEHMLKKSFSSTENPQNEVNDEKTCDEVGPNFSLFAIK